MRAGLVALAALAAAPAAAETLVATRLIRAQEVIGPGDVTLSSGEVPGALTDPAAAVGREARVALYPGRPVMRGQTAPPALVERNQIVTVVYAQGGLRLTAEARALGRAAAGERVRVMNLSSRLSVTGTVAEDGSVRVQP
ncbi:flagella basal body P-ring formation protein FlgA [Rhodosalinus halophilus]|uniref:Flagella basal body P-ring formation protein FlgA n=1 Tax=Rhodosalinus halophilus TaxID=2259333 RepID=A0A365U7N2_9RHOB|nr:flagellar basal body P-ring formation chaperone FlgA [Rhodosalinus halophilus]RBI84627.1 flagella basal body P-ring formation protein FlgA [Rhodosalinus halophilus]